MIQQINGQPVYIIKAEATPMATTSSGESFAQMYSQLRWQIYEDIYEEMTAQNEWNRETYDSQMDAYQAAAKDIRNQIQSLQKIRQDAIDSGRFGIDESMALHRLNSSIEGSNARLANQLLPTMTTSTKPAVDAFGRVTGDEVETTSTRERVAGFREVVDPETGDVEVVPVAARAGGASTVSREDVLGQVEPVDTTALDEQIAKLEADLAGLDRPTAPTRLSADDAKRQFTEQVGVIGQGGGPFGVAAEPQRPVRDQIESNRDLRRSFDGLREEVRSIRSGESALQDEVETLASTRGSVFDEESPALREARDLFGDMPLEDGRPDTGLTMPAAEPTALTEEAERLPAAPSSELDAAMNLFGEQQPVATRGQDFVTPQEAPPIQFAPSADSVGSPDMLGGQPIERVDAATPTEEVFGTGAEVQPTAQQEVPKAAPAPNRQQRKNKYIANVAKGAMTLVNQPRKLQRLAKTNLEESQRPSWAVVVDKLSTVNKGKPNGTLNTYQELARHFRDDPDTMRQAHEYAMAKSILDSEDSTPLA